MENGDVLILGVEVIKNFVQIPNIVKHYSRSGKKFQFAIPLGLGAKLHDIKCEAMWDPRFKQIESHMIAKKIYN